MRAPRSPRGHGGGAARGRLQGTFRRAPPIGGMRSGHIDDLRQAPLAYSARKLYELQELDWKISAADSSLAEVRDGLADESAVLAVRERIDGISKQLGERTGRRAEVEAALSMVADQLGSVEAKVYGGSVTSERQYEAFDEERKFLRHRQAEGEEELLQLMVDMDELQPALAEAERGLEALEADRGAERERLLVEERRLVGELAALGAERKLRTPGVPAHELSLYETLKAARGGHAVAKLERGMCQGCRISLPAGELQRARNAAGPVQCDSCRRILYVV